MTTSNTKPTEIGEYSDSVKARVAEKDKQMERWRKAWEESVQPKRIPITSRHSIEFALAQKDEERERRWKAWQENSHWKPLPMPMINLKSTSYIPLEETSEKRKEYMKHLRSVQESEGFDIVDYYGDTEILRLGGSAVRRTNIDKVETRKELDSIVKLAMDEYNHTNKTDFEIIEIKHCNEATSRAYFGYVYYITFTAMKMDEKKTFTFQAKGNGTSKFNPDPKVIFVRLKPLTSHSDDQSMCK